MGFRSPRSSWNARRSSPNGPLPRIISVEAELAGKGLAMLGDGKGVVHAYDDTTLGRLDACDTDTALDFRDHAILLMLSSC